MSNPILLLNQPQVFNGLGTLTHTLAATGNYNVSFQATMPEAVAIDGGAGSGVGLGAGTGGGGEGFTGGDLGTGHGGVGQGFGTSNGYQQPPAAASNVTAASPVSSALVVLVKKNGSTIFTAPTVAAYQPSMQFKYGFLAAANDVITVVLSSVNSSDAVLNGLKSIASINQGF
jgi:hypothetical protein